MNPSCWCATLVACAAISAGCGKSEGNTAHDKVAARVNAELITEEEVQSALARRPSGARARDAVLEHLIDERLARQRAREVGLERAPQVTQAIASATDEILARAYLQQVAEAQAQPTREEVAQYYAEHPELFAQRRLYSLEEIAVARHGGIGPALHQRALQGQSIDQIAGWLESLALNYTVNRGGRAAEQIPLEMLPKLQALRQGEVHVVEAGSDSVVLIRVAAARPAPLDEAAAAPLIERFLSSERAAEAIAREKKRLRQAARIEYLGAPGAMQ